MVTRRDYIEPNLKLLKPKTDREKLKKAMYDIQILKEEVDKLKNQNIFKRLTHDFLSLLHYPWF
jgi:uncharacterized protein YqgQ